MATEALSVYKNPEEYLQFLDGEDYDGPNYAGVIDVALSKLHASGIHLQAPSEDSSDASTGHQQNENTPTRFVVDVGCGGGNLLEWLYKGRLRSFVDKGAVKMLGLDVVEPMVACAAARTVKSGVPENAVTFSSGDMRALNTTLVKVLPPIAEPSTTTSTTTTTTTTGESTSLAKSSEADDVATAQHDQFEDDSRMIGVARCALIMNYFTVQHVDTAGLQKTLQEAAAALTFGGIFVLAFWSGEGRIEYPPPDDNVVAYKYPIEQVKKMARDARLIVVSERHDTFSFTEDGDETHAAADENAGSGEEKPPTATATATAAVTTEAGAEAQKGDETKVKDDTGAAEDEAMDMHFLVLQRVRFQEGDGTFSSLL